MIEKEIKSRFQIRRDTQENWETKNPILKQGEPCLDTTNNILKIGQGKTWNETYAFSGQPDWAERDSNQPSFIKNKPFGIKDEQELLSIDDNITLSEAKSFIETDPTAPELKGTMLAPTGFDRQSPISLKDSMAVTIQEPGQTAITLQMTHLNPEQDYQHHIFEDAGQEYIRFTFNYNSDTPIKVEGLSKLFDKTVNITAKIIGGEAQGDWILYNNSLISFNSSGVLKDFSYYFPEKTLSTLSEKSTLDFKIGDIDYKKQSLKILSIPEAGFSFKYYGNFNLLFSVLAPGEPNPFPCEDTEDYYLGVNVGPEGRDYNHLIFLEIQKNIYPFQTKIKEITYNQLPVEYVGQSDLRETDKTKNEYVKNKNIDNFSHTIHYTFPRIQGLGSSSQVPTPDAFPATSTFSQTSFDTHRFLLESAQTYIIRAPQIVFDEQNIATNRTETLYANCYSLPTLDPNAEGGPGCIITNLTRSELENHGIDPLKVIRLDDTETINKLQQICDFLLVYTYTSFPGSLLNLEAIHIITPETSSIPYFYTLEVMGTGHSWDLANSVSTVSDRVMSFQTFDSSPYSVNPAPVFMDRIPAEISAINSDSVEIIAAFRSEETGDFFVSPHILEECYQPGNIMQINCNVSGLGSYTLGTVTLVKEDVGYGLSVMYGGDGSLLWTDFNKHEPYQVFCSSLGATSDSPSIIPNTPPMTFWTALGIETSHSDLYNAIKSSGVTDLSTISCSISCELIQGWTHKNLISANFNNLFDPNEDIDALDFQIADWEEDFIHASTFPQTAILAEAKAKEALSSLDGFAGGNEAKAENNSIALGNYAYANNGDVQLFNPYGERDYSGKIDKNRTKNIYIETQPLYKNHTITPNILPNEKIYKSQIPPYGINSSISPSTHFENAERQRILPPESNQSVELYQKDPILNYSAGQTLSSQYTQNFPTLTFMNGTLDLEQLINSKQSTILKFSPFAKIRFEGTRCQVFPNSQFIKLYGSQWTKKIVQETDNYFILEYSTLPIGFDVYKMSRIATNANLHRVFNFSMLKTQGDFFLSEDKMLYIYIDKNQYPSQVEWDTICTNQLFELDIEGYAGYDNYARSVPYSSSYYIEDFQRFTEFLYNNCPSNCEFEFRPCHLIQRIAPDIEVVKASKYQNDSSNLSISNISTYEPIELIGMSVPKQKAIEDFFNGENPIIPQAPVVQIENNSITEMLQNECFSQYLIGPGANIIIDDSSIHYYSDIIYIKPGDIMKWTKYTDAQNQTYFFASTKYFPSKYENNRDVRLDNVFISDPTYNIIYGHGAKKPGDISLTFKYETLEICIYPKNQASTVNQFDLLKEINNLYIWGQGFLDVKMQYLGDYSPTMLFGNTLTIQSNTNLDYKCIYSIEQKTTIPLQEHITHTLSTPLVIKDNSNLAQFKITKIQGKKLEYKPNTNFLQPNYHNLLINNSLIHLPFAKDSYYQVRNLSKYHILGPDDQIILRQPQWNGDTQHYDFICHSGIYVLADNQWKNKQNDIFSWNVSYSTHITTDSIEVNGFKPAKQNILTTTESYVYQVIDDTIYFKGQHGKNITDPAIWYTTFNQYFLSHQEKPIIIIHNDAGETTLQDDKFIYNIFLDNSLENTINSTGPTNITITAEYELDLKKYIDNKLSK